MITVEVKTSWPKLDALMAAFSPERRKAVHEGGAASLLDACRRHLRAAAATRHDSADRLGAMRTGHLERAAETMTMSASSDSGAVNVLSAGFARVFAPQTIRPAAKQSLTIPVHAIAYGRSVAEVRRNGFDIFRPKGKDYLATIDTEGNFSVLYLLRKVVNIPQDRGLLPADADMTAAAKAGIKATITKILGR